MPTDDYRICLLWIDHWSTCFKPAEWAAWVQALLSAAAIGGSFWLGQWQARKEASRSRAEADAAKLQAIHAAYRRAYFCIDHGLRVMREAGGQVETAIRFNRQFRFDVQGFLDVRAAFSAIERPLLTPTAYDMLHSFLLHFARIEFVCHSLVDGRAKLEENLVTTVYSYVSIVQQIRDALKEAMDRREIHAHEANDWHLDTP
jgi:hypothetical protein